MWMWWRANGRALVQSSALGTNLSQLHLSTSQQCPENISIGFNVLSLYISFQNGSPRNIGSIYIYMPNPSQPTLHCSKNKWPYKSHSFRSGNIPLHYSYISRDSSVGIAARYRLDGPRIESRWRIFRTRPDLTDSPPSLLYDGYRVFPGGKASGTWCWKYDSI
jgi:hypothetical protein